MTGSSCVSESVSRGVFSVGSYWNHLKVFIDKYFLQTFVIENSPFCLLSSTYKAHLFHKKYKCFFFFSITSVIYLQQKLWMKYASSPKALSPPALNSAVPFPLHLFLWSWLCVRSSIRVLRYPGERRDGWSYFSLFYTTLRNKWDP